MMEETRAAKASRAARASQPLSLPPNTWREIQQRCDTIGVRAELTDDGREVVHVHHETPAGVMNRYRREGMAFKRIYPEAHFNLYDFARNTLASIGFDLLHAARQRLFFRSLGSILWFRTAQFWGTYQGYRLSSPLTPELRQTFYYHVGWEKTRPQRRDIQPIDYKEIHNGL